ncbi:MAG TPA: beta-galactosidase GalA [Asticcacaulis sp.]|nr:beta-galactosidase GalA [Asticcacaulis sp.]
MTHPARRDILVSASALALLVSGAASAQTAAKAATPALARAGRTLFDDGWRFAFGHLWDQDKDFGFGKNLRTFAKQGPDGGDASKAGFDDSKWRELSLPHDWAVELPFVDSGRAKSLKADDHGMKWDAAADHGFKPLGRDFPETSVGWYRKTLTLDAADKGKRINLEFDGIFRNAIVLFNGYIVRQHDGGYTPFSVDVTDFLNTDGKPNIIAIRVDASLGEGWFYEGAGIYRHVWLTKTEAVHIPQYGVWIRPNADGSLEIRTTIRNTTAASRLITVSQTFDADIAANTVTKSVAADDTLEVTQLWTAGKRRAWSLEDPHLYVLQTVLLDENKTEIDRVTTRFGFRDIKFDADTGFFLNGKSIKLKGTCNHQDHAGVGSALPDALQRYRLTLLKELGCNAIRTSHNPPTPELLDACDEMGILVLDETRMMTSSDVGLEQLSTMIRRDRNHPSVILWSIGNEEQSQQGTPRGAVIAWTMKRLVNQLDPTRLITAAMDGGYGLGITEVVDVMGFNYRDNKIDDFHKDFPKKPIIGTETASTVSTRGEYARDEAKHIVPAYDTDAPWWAATAEQWWPHFDAKPYIGGGFVWTGFDYRGEPTPFSTYPSISSQFGIMDTCGFPKDVYYYYRAWWRPEPLLHLFPHWNWEGKEGQTVSVWAYSNADEVELFVNGKSAGKKAMTKDMHVEWSVPYAPGKIEAFAYKAGKVILKDARETAGPAARIVLTADRATLAADGRDCAVLRAEVVDAKGRTVPKAGNLVTFAAAGPGAVIGVGNGDPNCLEADKASKRSAFNGLCCAIVQTSKSNGLISITASADGLKSGTVTLKSA